MQEGATETSKHGNTFKKNTRHHKYSYKKSAAADRSPPHREMRFGAFYVGVQNQAPSPPFGEASPRKGAQRHR